MKLTIGNILLLLERMKSQKKYNRPFSTEKFNELFGRLQGFLQGRDVFVPVDYIFGGRARAGESSVPMREITSIATTPSCPPPRFVMHS